VICRLGRSILIWTSGGGVHYTLNIAAKKIGKNMAKIEDIYSGWNFQFGRILLRTGGVMDVQSWVY